MYTSTFYTPIDYSIRHSAEPLDLSIKPQNNFTNETAIIHFHTYNNNNKNYDNDNNNNNKNNNNEYKSATKEDLDCSSLSEKSFPVINQRPFKLIKPNGILASKTLIPIANSLPCSDEDLDSEEEDFARRVSEDSNRNYKIFLEKMKERLTETPGTINSNMRRVQNSDNKNDPDYLEKRRKNNESAKRSRDSRKLKQEQIQLRVAFLKEENMTLICRIDSFTQDIKILRQEAKLR